MLKRLTEAARELNVSESTARRLADAGVLPCVKDSTGQRLFTDLDIETAKARRAAK